MVDSASAIKAAEAALDKGNYVFCINIIEPLLLSFPADTKIGAQLRLLKITAHMGRGDEQKAIDICRSLINNKETIIRQQSKQLLSILDAPSLPRPTNWSVEIPNIEIDPSLKSSSKKQKKKKEKISYPPTGPTKNLDLGFSIITLVSIVLITFFLSGCVKISTNLSITSSDRLNLSLDIDSNSGKLIPFQLEFEEKLIQSKNTLKLKEEGSYQHFESSTIRFDEAKELLQQITLSASKASGLNLKSPEITIDNKNWIIGTKQNLTFYYDLSELYKIPGLQINLILENIENKKDLKTEPLKATFKEGLVSFPLQIGDTNMLNISYWKWNKISIGIILIIFITLLSISLQAFRLKMGFGFPELPP